MRSKTCLQFAIALALAGAACAAQAHRPWMIPNTSAIETDKEAWVTIDAAISENLFETDHLPQRLDGLTVTDPDGATAPAPSATVGKHRATVDIRLPKDGTYRITLAATNVMGSYKLGAETRRFRSTEAALASEIPAGASDVKKTVVVQRQDTFVTLNKPSATALKATGTGLELVPVTNPTVLRAGEKATFRFQLDGKPLPNFAFSLVPGGVKYRGTLGEVRLATDANGDATFTLPAPNLYWLSASVPGEAKRYTYAATFEILPE